MQPGIRQGADSCRGSLECAWTAVGKQTWPPKECVVYSFGSNGDFTFELAVSRLGCQVHTFDPSMAWFIKQRLDQQLLSTTNIRFQSIGLGVKDENNNQLGWKMRTLESLMASLSHDRLEILKIDIENGEWPVLNWLFHESDLLKRDSIRQIVLEIHMFDFFTDVARVRKVMTMFERFGFLLWARDINRGSPLVLIWPTIMHGCFELSFVRTELVWP
jgi:hypothetical protein